MEGVQLLTSPTFREILNDLWSGRCRLCTGAARINMEIQTHWDAVLSLSCSVHFPRKLSVGGFVRAIIVRISAKWDVQSSLHVGLSTVCTGIEGETKVTK